MSVIVLPGSAPASSCRIGYQNLLELGAVTASSENASYPVENCFDWNTADFFRPAAGGTVTIDLTLDDPAAADYFAFYGQDIYRYGGTLKLQYHDGSGWVDASVGVTPADNAPRMVFFDSITASQWRVTITCGSVFNLGVLAFGTYLAPVHGMYLNWSPPKLARANRLLSNVSDSGAFLGRSIVSKGIQTTLELQFAADEWVRDEWLTFMLHAEQKPFFWAPDVSAYPNDAALCWVEGDLTPPRHTQYGFMSASIQVRGLVE